MTSSTIVTIISMINLPLVIAAVVIFFRIKNARDPRMAIALKGAIAMMGFELIAITLRFGEIEPIQFGVILLQDSILFLKLWVMFYVGQRLWAERGVDYWGLENLRRQPRKTIWIGVTATLALVLYSVLLFKAAHPAYGPVAKMLGIREADGIRETLLILLVVANYAVSEEIIFRGCFQPMFMRWFGESRRGDIGAIVCTTLLWTFMHFGVLDPDWVKLVQVLPLGIFLSLWFRHAGFIGCVGVHLLFNLILTPFASSLVAP